MVKKFRLIKKYPGSPKLGTEIFNWDYSNPDERWNFNGNKGALLLIPQKDVIDNPEFWEEVKSPILTTEDEVDIFNKEQEVYLVNPVNCSVVKIKAYQWDNTRLIFFHNQAVKNYIKLHKPVLSYGDVLEIFDEWRKVFDNNRDDFKKELTELVKSKL